MEDKDYISNLTENDFKYCEEVLNENEEKRVTCVNEIREWLQNNQHLNACEDTFNILRFLRSTKYNIESTKKKINDFYTFKSKVPEWFRTRDPMLPEIQSLLKIGVFLPLLKRDNNGQLVIIIRTAAHDPSIHKQNDVFKVGMMALDLALKAEDTSVYGIVAIFDMKGVTLGHAKVLTVQIIKKAVTSWQIYPVRLRALEFINSPSYIDVVLNIFRFFMTQKIKNRIHIHGTNYESLHSIVPKEILPEEYGGTDGKLRDLIDYWHQNVSDSRQWLMETEKNLANTDSSVQL
ncbi:retinol-binding protein pinta [Halyomorpha halys]|uniref:retinol-binding protein pinta n=1 Tax=Halyomorpha halys TaxID=286706 RepID=UPI0006D4F4A3|nr:retinol-binding protein pinta [Halyomorpha halys]